MKLSSQKSNKQRGSGNDFSSILDETPWERFTDKAKPIAKLLVVVVIIGGLVYGGKLLFTPKNQSVESSEMNSQSVNSDAQKLSECIQSANAANPVPDTSDSEFYKKLINGYDQQLNCYAQYPNEDSVGKSKIEGLKSQALDSSGSYKDTYTSSHTATQPSSSQSSAPSTNTSSYNPSACNGKLSTYNDLKNTSDGNKSAYDSAFSARHDYGYFYDQSRDKSIADQQYKLQEDRLNALQKTWQDSLSAVNAAYGDYQKCQSNNLK